MQHLHGDMAKGYLGYRHTQLHTRAIYHSRCWLRVKAAGNVTDGAQANYTPTKTQHAPNKTPQLKHINNPLMPTTIVAPCVPLQHGKSSTSSCSSTCLLSVVSCGRVVWHEVPHHTLS